MKDEVALKPCPFCGAREIAHSYNHRSLPANVYYVCGQCGAGPYAENGNPETKEAWDAAGKLWNTRAAAQTEAVQEMVEALKAEAENWSPDPRSIILQALESALASHRKATSKGE
jgi:acyl-CoA reductase-like NAD-dependent aldehyde dehydrogenase